MEKIYKVCRRHAGLKWSVQAFCGSDYELAYKTKDYASAIDERNRLNAAIDAERKAKQADYDKAYKDRSKK